METRGGSKTGTWPERRDPALLRQQRALLPKAWSIMGKIRGERPADRRGEGGAAHRAGGKTGSSSAPPLTPTVTSSQQVESLRHDCSFWNGPDVVVMWHRLMGGGAGGLQALLL